MSEGYASTAYRGPIDYVPPRKRKPSPVRLILASSPEVEKFVLNYNQKLAKKTDEDYNAQYLKLKMNRHRVVKELKKDEIGHTAGDINETIGADMGDR